MYGFRTGVVGGRAAPQAPKMGPEPRMGPQMRDERRFGGLDEATGESVCNRSHIAELR